MPSIKCGVTKHPRNLEGRAESVLLVITCVSTVVGDTHTPSTGTKNIYVTIARRKAIWHQFAGKREKEGSTKVVDMSKLMW